MLVLKHDLVKKWTIHPTRSLGASCVFFYVTYAKLILAFSMLFLGLYMYCETSLMLLCGLLARLFSIQLSKDRLYMEPGDSVPLALNEL